MAERETITELSSLRQGDVITTGDELKHLGPEIAIVSQTCDIVNVGSRKTHITVAPILQNPDGSQLADARRGWSPLLVHLEVPEHEYIADLQYVTAIRKDYLINGTVKLLGSSAEAAKRRVSARIGRAYARYAFEDEIVDIFSNLRRRATTAVGKGRPLGDVLSKVSDIRIALPTPLQHDPNESLLKLWFIADPKTLQDQDLADPNWTWASSGLEGTLDKNDLTSISVCLFERLVQHEEDPEKSDATTLMHLWNLWAQQVTSELIHPNLPETMQLEFELVNENEFTYSDFRLTESLDLEGLSSPTATVKSSRSAN